MIFDKTKSMEVGEKISEGEKFLKNVRGKYKTIYLRDENEEEVIKRIKENKISRILLISDGYLSRKIKDFLENSGIPVDVFTFPRKKFEENFKVNIPSFVREREEFLIKISFFSQKKEEGELEIKTGNFQKRQKLLLEEGMNHFNFKHIFEKRGKEKILISFKTGEGIIEREYEIQVVEERPRIVIISEKPLPLIKLIRDFIKKNVKEDMEIFVKISKDVIKKINKTVERATLPEETDWLIVISPDLLKNYEKTISASKIFYFYEDLPYEKLNGKGILKGENFLIELPSTQFKISIKREEGEKLMELLIQDKSFPLIIEKGKQTHFLLTNLFEILFSLDEKIRDSILKYIFKITELKNPEIIFYEIPEKTKENEEFRIKSFVLTPLLKPAFDSEVFLKIKNQISPMIYEGEGIFSTYLKLPSGEYEFEIIAKRGDFSKSIKGTLKINSSEIEKGVDFEYLSFLARKNGGREISNEYFFPQVHRYTRKYHLDLRKNLLSYILIALLFSIEIFLRKREGLL